VSNTIALLHWTNSNIFIAVRFLDCAGLIRTSVVSGTAIVGRRTCDQTHVQWCLEHVVAGTRPGSIGSACRGWHATWQHRECMSQTESRWLEWVTPRGGASQPLAALRRWALTLLRSRTSLAGPSYCLPQRPAPPLERLSSRLVWDNSKFSESSAVIEPHSLEMAPAARPIWMAASNQIHSACNVDCCWDELELVQASVPGWSTN
jgi:hypothetical protein